MKAIGVQFDIAWEDPQENFGRLGGLFDQAALEKADLVVLPEMFATGFTMASAEAAVFAPAIRGFLASMAKKHGFWLMGGLAEPHEPMPRNACALYDPSGRESLLYHKLHPFTLAGEHECFTPGDSLRGIDIEGTRVTPLICYDLRFPEPFRAAASKTDLFVVMANWPTPRIAAWRTLLAARAVENQCYVLGVNRVGEGDGKVYTGDSILVDPMGEVLAAAAPGETALVGGEVSPLFVDEMRKRFSFLSDRRPRLYRELEERGGF